MLLRALWRVCWHLHGVLLQKQYRAGRLVDSDLAFSSSALALPRAEGSFSRDGDVAPIGCYRHERLCWKTGGVILRAVRITRHLHGVLSKRNNWAA